MIISRLLLSLSSFFGVLVIWTLKNMKSIFPDQTVYILIISFGILGLWIIGTKILISCLRKKKLHNESLNVIEMEPLEGIALPIHIGLFLMALGLDISLTSIIILFSLFFLWLKLESVSYFNIVLLFLGFHFYKIKTNSGSFCLISKEKDCKIKNGKEKPFKDLYRINNFTFIQFEEE